MRRLANSWQRWSIPTLRGPIRLFWCHHQLARNSCCSRKYPAYTVPASASTLWRVQAAIKQLMMEQFFTESNIDRFLSSEMSGGQSLNPTCDLRKSISILRSIHWFNVIENSQFGGMLAMFGSTEALEPMKAPFVEDARIGYRNRFKEWFSEGMPSRKNWNHQRWWTENQREHRSDHRSAIEWTDTEAGKREMVQTMIRSTLAG